MIEWRARDHISPKKKHILTLDSYVYKPYRSAEMYSSLPGELFPQSENGAGYCFTFEHLFSLRQCAIVP